MSAFLTGSFVLATRVSTTTIEPRIRTSRRGGGSARDSASNRLDQLNTFLSRAARERRKDWRSVRKGACVWIFRRREGAARRTLSPGDRADRGLASVRDLDWLGPNRRREGCIHVHQTYRYAARFAGRRSPAQGPLSRRPANAQGRHSAESRE